MSKTYYNSKCKIFTNIFLGGIILKDKITVLIADDNREGIRIYFDDENKKGWLLLRLSVHDPIMPLNIESDVKGGVKLIAEEFYSFISKMDKLDISSLEDFLN